MVTYGRCALRFAVTLLLLSKEALMKTKSSLRSFLALALAAALLALPACGKNTDTAGKPSSAKSSSAAQPGKTETSSSAADPTDSTAVGSEAPSTSGSGTTSKPATQTNSKTPTASTSSTAAKPTGSTAPKPTSSTATKPDPAPSTPSTPSAITPLTPLAASSYYGRSKLSGGELTAYNRIVDGVENSKTEIDLSDCKLTETTLTKVLTYYRADYPQHFWLGNQYSMTLSSTTGLIKIFKPQYTFTGAKLTEAKKAVNEAVQNMLKKVSGSWSDYDRELAIHDWLCRNIAYVDGDNAHNLYGVFVEKKAVCEGYAKAMQYLLYQSGVSCLYVTGMSAVPNSARSEAHAWNIVRINKEYYHVDVTWDDQNNLFHAYMNLTDSQIKEDHTIDSDNYPLPTCNATVNSYAVRSGCLLNSYDVNTVGNAIRSGNGTAHFILPGSTNDFLNWFKNNMNAIAKAAGYNGGFSYTTNSLGHEVIVTMK